MGNIRKKKSFIAKAFTDCITSVDGKTIDPARLIGYGIVMLGTLVWLGGTIYEIIVKRTFDGTNFAIGLGGLSAALTGAAAGTMLKNGSEPPATTPPATATPAASASSD